METCAFVATQVGVDEEFEYALVAGVSSGANTYLMFQRDAESAVDDWGVYFEFNDQISSGYQCIRCCTLSRRRLCVELARPIDPQKRINGIDVELQISDMDFDLFAVMLRRVFRQHESLLTIADCGK